MKNVMSKGTVKTAGLLGLNNRVNYFKVSPKGMENVMIQERYVNKIKMDRQLIPVIKFYVSILNGCSYCIEMHYKEAVKKRVDKEKIKCILNIDIKNNIFSEEEKTILDFAKKLTLISDNNISEEDYLNVRKYISEKEYIDLVLLINQVNNWNRISISTGNTGKELNVE